MQKLTLSASTRKELCALIKEHPDYEAGDIFKVAPTAYECTLTKWGPTVTVKIDLEDGAFATDTDIDRNDVRKILTALPKVIGFISADLASELVTWQEADFDLMANRMALAAIKRYRSRKAKWRRL